MGNSTYSDKAVERGRQDYKAGKHENPYLRHSGRFAAMAAWWEKGHLQEQLKHESMTTK